MVAHMVGACVGVPGTFDIAVVVVPVVVAVVLAQKHLQGGALRLVCQYCSLVLRAAICCKAEFMVDICCWRFIIFSAKLLCIVLLALVNWEITVELAANTSPKFATASSRVVSSSPVLLAALAV